MTSADGLRRFAPRSLSGRVTLAAVGAVGVALALAGAAVVIAAGRADRSALDRDLGQLVTRLDRPAGAAVRRAGFRSGRAAAGDRARAGGGGLAPDAGGEIGGQLGGTVIGPDGGIRRRSPPPPLDPGSDRFARVVFADGQSVSQGTEIPASFPLPAPHDTPASVEAGGEDWRTVTRRLPDGRTLQVAARLEPLQADARRLLLIVLAALGAALLATALVTRSLARLALAPLERLRSDRGRGRRDRRPRQARPRRRGARGGRRAGGRPERDARAARRAPPPVSVRRSKARGGSRPTPGTSCARRSRASRRTSRRARSARRAAMRGGSPRSSSSCRRWHAGRPGRLRAPSPSTSPSSPTRRCSTCSAATLRSRRGSMRRRTGPWSAGSPRACGCCSTTCSRTPRATGGPEATCACRSAVVRTAPSIVLVDDDGPGIPAAERERVLERFARGSGARGEGTGPRSRDRRRAGRAPRRQPAARGR